MIKSQSKHTKSNTRMTKPQIVTSWDDGHPLDTRIAALLRENKLHGIFFWTVQSVRDAGKHPNWMDAIASDFIVGSHGIEHRNITSMEEAEIIHEVQHSRGFLQSRFDQPVRWFCPPRGYYNERASALIADAGYSWMRTTKFCWLENNDNPLIVHPDIHVYNSRDEYEGLSWLDFARRRWTLACETGQRRFHIWGHSWEIQKQDQWDNLALFLKEITQ